MIRTRLDNLIYALVATVGEAVVALEHAGALHGEDALLGRPGVRDHDAREGRGAAHVVLCVFVFFCVRGEVRRAVLWLLVKCSWRLRRCFAVCCGKLRGCGAAKKFGRAC